jgi:hypothetical protein
MKNVLILSEAIYKGQHKLVNQGAFINFSDLINDIFACDGLTCACNGNRLQKSDIFIRKAYLIYSRKKPGANWTSLEKIVKDVYNCCAGTTLCPSKKEQWWITTDVIRPAKTIETINFTNIIIKVLTCCEILNCCGPVVPPGPLYNFDITALDWPGTNGVTDQASFEAFILGSSNYTNITVNSFNYTPTRIQANINVTGGSSLDFGSFGNGFEIIHALSGFDNLSSLSLGNNLLTDFNPTIPLDSTLGSLYLNNNLIVNFNPTIPLPTNLGLLNLNNNLIANFNPTIALPSSLLTLELKNNQIVTFNPTNPLPSPIFLLNLDNNLLTDFNPTTLFPTTSLMDLRLKNNLITTAGYVASEPWANSLSAGMSAIQFAGNVDSVAGTNLESILTGKGYNVIP